MSSAKLPAFQFYPADWMRDTALRAVSLAARGLWMDLLCLMWDSPTRGVLATASRSPYSLEQIARMAGCSTDEAGTLLEELKSVGVCSIRRDGSVYSRRMVRDERERAAGRLRVQEFRRKSKAVNKTVTPSVTPLYTPSSSSSSSSITEEEQHPPSPSSESPPIPEAWQTDEAYQRFQAEYVRAKPNLIADDFAEAYRPWLRLSFEQRIQAVQGVRERIDGNVWNDPQYVIMPAKYLRSEWKRPVIPRKQLQTQNGQVQTFGERKEQRIDELFRQGLAWEASLGKV